MTITTLLDEINRGLVNGRLFLNSEVKVADMGFGGFNDCIVSTDNSTLYLEPVNQDEEE